MQVFAWGFAINSITFITDLAQEARDGLHPGNRIGDGCRIAMGFLICFQ